MNETTPVPSKYNGLGWDIEVQCEKCGYRFDISMQADEPYLCSSCEEDTHEVER